MEVEPSHRLPRHLTNIVEVQKKIFLSPVSKSNFKKGSVKQISKRIFSQSIIVVQKKFKKVNQNFGDSGTLHRGGEQWLGQGLPTCHWVYCSQAANKKVKKN